MDKTGRLIHVLQMRRERDRVGDKCEMKIRPNKNRMDIRLLSQYFFFQVTYNPKAIKLHTILIEFLDFLLPPVCCCIAEEVRECSVSPETLNMRH